MSEIKKLYIAFEYLETQAKNFYPRFIGIFENRGEAEFSCKSDNVVGIYDIGLGSVVPENLRGLEWKANPETQKALNQYCDKKIMKYKVFETSEFFELWQENNPSIKVHSVIPVQDKFSFKEDFNGNHDAQLKFNVFVTYLE